ncbi:MAG: YraN family protein [Streptosporangiales bacterium]|nr:YraN family protein [Streptosporangiales bacterium]
MRGKDLLGSHGEDAAARYLVGLGFEILDRNWSCAEGELDIVARDGGVLVVCEVKTRSGLGFGAPVEAVTVAKARRLRRLAALWLAAHPAGYSDIRFDVVGVVAIPGENTRIEHLRAVC